MPDKDKTDRAIQSSMNKAIRDTVQGILDDEYHVFSVSVATWNILEADSMFRQHAADRKYKRCAAMAYAIMRIALSGKGSDTAHVRRKRGNYEKKIALERYRRFTQFAADAFHRDIVENFRLTPEQQERVDREGTMLLSSHESIELRIGKGKSQQVIKRTPDWSRIMEQWNEANPNPKERINTRKLCRQYYTRFITRLGYVPSGSLNFAESHRIMPSREMLRFYAKLCRDYHILCRDRAMESTAEQYRLLAEEIDACLLIPEGDWLSCEYDLRVYQVYIKLEALLTADKKKPGE